MIVEASVSGNEGFRRISFVWCSKWSCATFMVGEGVLFFSIRGCAMNEALGDLWEGLDGSDLLGSGMLVVNSLPD